MTGVVLVLGRLAEAAAAGGGHDPDDTRRQAHEIVTSGPFKESTNWIQKVLQWIADRLPSFSAGRGGGPGGAGNVVTIVLLLVAAFLVVRVARTWRRVPRAEAEGFDALVDVTPRRTADEWAARAEACARDGRWDEAVQARYAELVARLVDEGSLADVPGRTAGEYRAELPVDRPAAAAAFAAATDLFELVWYGGRPADEADHDRLRSLAADVLRAQRATAGRP